MLHKPQTRPLGARSAGWHALACALVLALAPNALADSYSDGKDLYDAKNFPAALAKFQQAASERPTEAKVQWMMGLTQLKLRNAAGAAAAFESAQRLDPGIKFTKPDKFQSRLARARAMMGAPMAPRPVAAPRPMGVPPAGVAPNPGGVAFFPEPVLNQAARDMVQNRRWVRDYAGGLIQPADVARLEGLVATAGEKGADVRIIALPAAVGGRERLVGERVWNLIKGSDRDVLVIATPRGAWARSAKIRGPSLQRILVDSQKDFLISVGQGLYSVAAKIAAVHGIKQDRAAGKKRTWIIVLAVVGGILLIIIIAAVIRSNKKKAGELEEYKNAYNQAVEGMGRVADKLTDLQLSVQIVDDEDARSLVKRAEGNYFAAQSALGKLPEPKQGTVDTAGVRRFAGMVQEADSALDKAEEIVKRLTDGKPVDKARILADGGKKLGCYFCSRPMRAESDGKIVGIELKGQKMDVLSCMNCAGEYDRGQTPKVRMVEYEGRNVHWSQVPQYDPWYDYYHYDRYRATWVDVVVMAAIFDWGYWHAHPSPYVTWYPPGVYHYPSYYQPTYINVDTYARDRDVDAVIGSSWDQGSAPSGISFAGVEGYDGGAGAGASYGGDVGGGAADASGGRDVS